MSLKLEVNCPKHQKKQISYINYHAEKIELICHSCFTGIQKLQPNTPITNLIHINTALNDPIYFINQLRKETNKKQTLEVFRAEIKEKSEKFKQIINNLQEMATKMQKEFEDFSQKILDGLDKIFSETKALTQHSRFRGYMETLQTNSTSIDEIKKVEKELHEYLHNQRTGEQENLSKILFGCFEKASMELRNGFLELKKFNEQNLVAQLAHEEIRTMSSYQFYLQDLFPSSLCSSEFQQQLFKQINIKSKLIYSGSKNGLSSTKFKQAINNKSKLLMIFQSKSGNVFGGYSPCLWEVSKQISQADTSLKSFIFSDKKKQIYPIQASKCQQALVFSDDCLVQFGVDIVIGNNFSSGFSKLGAVYTCESSDGTNETEELFGSKTPEIIDCEVFQT